MTKYWLMKSEPSCFSIDDLRTASHQMTAWDGVRNYQARNFMRDDMAIGDQVFFITQIPIHLVSLVLLKSSVRLIQITRLLIQTVNTPMPKVRLIIQDGLWLISALKRNSLTSFLLIT